MKFLSIVSAIVVIQFAQFSHLALAMDGASPSDSGKSTEQAAWASIKESLNAMQLGDAEVQRVKALIEEEPLYREFLIEGNKEAKVHGGYTPLHFAARDGHLEVVKLLLDRGAQIEGKDNGGYTPLHWAARQGHLEVVKLLLDRGAQIAGKDRSDFTPLHLAAGSGHLEVVRLLLDHGADIQAQNNSGDTSLDQVRRFLERQPDHFKRDMLHKIIDILESLTAFHQRNAPALMSYIDEGKPVDLDLIKARLGHTQYQEAQSLAFLEALRVQAGLQTTPGASEVKVLTEGQEQTLNGAEAKEKVVELVRSWIVQQQALQAFHAFQQGEGEALRAHLEQGKAVDLELLRNDSIQTPYSQQRFLGLLSALKQGPFEGNAVTQAVIALIENQLTLENISFQVLRDNAAVEDLLGASTPQELIDRL